MATFPVPTASDVTAENAAIFQQLEKGLGQVPNLYATLAHSEHALGSYLAFQNAKRSLSKKETEVVNLVVSEVNACRYCLAAHTALGKMVGFDDDQILEIRSGRATFDPKLDALARFVRSVAENRGHPPESVTDALLEAGYTRGQLVDAIVVIGDKTVTNYLHGVTDVAVDFPEAPALDGTRTAA